ncbi:MAG TPA: hypothetical protein VKB88_44795 [Bryobacteraceae bacterium]|nr:hypothetical protein [Bryobacteraceae bacterium]
MFARIVLSVICVVASPVPIALAQSSGTFAATGAMITPRASHTATLLNNGKVLIAGGVSTSLVITLNSVYPQQTALASAEIYDPSTGMFTATGSMTAERTSHSATLLPDGRVLIAGGSADPQAPAERPLLIAEIYDPASETFTATGELVATPYGWRPSATLLRDGRVFVAGQPTAQIYDPATGMFAATTPYVNPAPGYMECAVLLADGRVLLTGGGDIGGWSELYDPISDSFSPAGSMNFWGDVYTATLLTSSMVLFVGNEENDGTPADAEVFDPAVLTFTRLPSAAADHEYAAAALLPDGSVLITGGQLPGGDGEVVSEIYTPATSTFSAAGNMVTQRHEHTATLLGDGTVLIAGGFSAWPAATSDAELYRPTVLIPAPLLFSLSGDGKGQGAVWHNTTGQLASPSSPAVAGEVLAMYTNNLIEGGVIPPQVVIGGHLAEVLYFGDAPGYPGFFQVNFRVPNGVMPGPAIPVRLTYLSRTSNEVTVALQ